MDWGDGKCNNKLGSKTMKARVSITWREELVEDERNFYMKLWPDVKYELVDVELAKNAAADKLLAKLQKAAKNKKGAK